jgi:hypothetical protein
LGIIVLLVIVAAGFGNSSHGPDGQWIKDKGLPRGFDTIMVKMDGSIVAAAIQIGPEMDPKIRTSS